jgi:hypothetical protein
VHLIGSCPELAHYWFYGTGACLSSLYAFWSHDLVATDSLPSGCDLRQGHAGMGPGLLRNLVTSPFRLLDFP